MKKTKVIKILEQNKIEYKYYDLNDDNFIDAINMANKINKNPDTVFKTLLVESINNLNKYYFILIPSNKILNLKKASKILNEKKLKLVNIKDLFKLTSYYHGGCSFIGSKNKYLTIIDKSCLNYSSILISAGKINASVEINTEVLISKFNLLIDDLID